MFSKVKCNKNNAVKSEILTEKQHKIITNDNTLIK